jgi:hypothetical protein
MAMPGRPVMTVQALLIASTPLITGYVEEVALRCVEAARGEGLSNVSLRGF